MNDPTVDRIVAKQYASDPPTEAERVHAARRWASWHLGGAAWADRILDAYRNPDAALAALDAEGAPT